MSNILNSKKRTSHRKLKIALAIVVVFLITFRLLLPTLAKHYLVDQLNKDPLYRGSAEGVQIHLWRGAYSATGIVIERVHGQKVFPFVKLEKFDVGIGWKEILHRSLNFKVAVKGVEINIVAEPTAHGTKVPVGGDSKTEKKQEAGNWHTVFKNLVPLDISRLVVDGTSLHFRDITKTPHVDVYLDELYIEGKNLTNTENFSGNLFGTVHLKARAMKSGKLDIDLNVNPIAVPPAFKIKITLEGLNLVELNPFFTAYGKFDVKKGTFKMYSEIASEHNKVIGYTKPLIEGLEVAEFKEDKNKGIIHAFWEQIVGVVGSIFKNHSKDRQAAKVPFEGRLDGPHIDIFATFKSVLENIFIKPISAKTDDSIHLEDVKKK